MNKEPQTESGSELAVPNVRLAPRCRHTLAVLAAGLIAMDGCVLISLFRFLSMLLLRRPFTVERCGGCKAVSIV